MGLVRLRVTTAFANYSVGQIIERMESVANQMLAARWYDRKLVELAEAPQPQPQPQSEPQHEAPRELIHESSPDPLPFPVVGEVKRGRGRPRKLPRDGP